MDSQDILSFSPPPPPSAAFISQTDLSQLAFTQDITTPQTGGSTPFAPLTDVLHETPPPSSETLAVLPPSPPEPTAPPEAPAENDVHVVAVTARGGLVGIATLNATTGVLEAGTLPYDPDDLDALDARRRRPL